MPGEKLQRISKELSANIGHDSTEGDFSDIARVENKTLESYH
jgi:hypothetical protein